MTKIWAAVLVTLVFGLIVTGYSNCLQLGQEAPQRLQHTVVGNPMTASLKIVDATCQVLLKAHPDLSGDQCQNGVLSTSFSSSLGVPSGFLNPFWTLVTAEQAGVLVADQTAVNGCILAIVQSDPSSPQVQNAYNSQLFNPFVAVVQMIPGPICPQIYSGSSFPNPTPAPTPPRGATVVDFDNPVPSGRLTGLFGGIDFGATTWDWTSAFDADTSNFIYNRESISNDLSFSFSQGPKLLLSINVFMKTSAGTITVYDDQGQSVSEYIPSDRSMHLIATGFNRSSNTIFIGGPTANNLGVDDITYQPPAPPPPISQVQSRDDCGLTAAAHSLSFLSSNTAGNLIIVQVDLKDGGNVTGVEDSVGDIYVEALPKTVGASGAAQQIWYASNIAGGSNQVTINLKDSVYSDISIHEYMGLDPVSPIDATLSSIGTGANPVAGPVNTGQANELIYSGVYGDMHLVQGSTPGFALRASCDGNIGEDRIATQIGPYSVSADYSWTANWIAQIVTFKARP